MRIFTLGYRRSGIPFTKYIPVLTAGHLSTLLRAVRCDRRDLKREKVGTFFGRDSVACLNQRLVLFESKPFQMLYIAKTK